MAASKLEEIVSCQQLPSLPSVAMRVIELSEDPEVQLPAISEVIQNDQALSGKILRTVNSSFYGLSDPCKTINRAMTYLGLNTIKSLVLGFSLAHINREPNQDDALLRHWRRVIYGAAAARRIAQELGHCDAEEAFTSALMQDIGGLAMHVALNGDYAQLVNQAGHDHFRLPEIERSELGFDHAEVGAALGERWKLPHSLITIIRNHHSPNPDAHHHLLQTITLGTQVAEIAAATITKPTGEACTDPRDAALSAMLERFTSCGECWYNINPERTGELVKQITEDASNLAALLEMDLGDSPDISAIMSRAEEVALMHQMRAEREREQLLQQNLTLSRMAQTCGLTGLANRRRFDQALQEHVETAIRDEECLAIIFIDADHFKQLNDTLGHQAGDIALIEIASHINDAIPEEGLACRYGGEEFVVMLPGTDRVAAARIAESIRVRISESPVDLREIDCHQSSVSLTVSLGVASIEPHTRSVVKNAVLLLKAADHALYHAKLSGRNRVQIFVPASSKARAA